MQRLKSVATNFLLLNLTGATAPRKTTMKHHKYHYHPQVKAAKLNARAEAAFGFVLALAIGIGLAVLLFFGLSS